MTEPAVADGIIRRLYRLEREVRRWRTIGGALVAIAFLVVASPELPGGGGEAGAG